MRFSRRVTAPPQRTKRPSPARTHAATAALVRRLGKRLKALRTERGLTQAAAAGKAGITLGHLQVVERGTGNPTIAVLAALARAYAVDVPELFAAG